ncbi:MAG: hypothetical protein ACK50J_27615, partial [Planctomyces sp.]
MVHRTAGSIRGAGLISGICPTNSNVYRIRIRFIEFLSRSGFCSFLTQARNHRRSRCSLLIQRIGHLRCHTDGTE